MVSAQYSAETRAKKSRAMTGRKFSAETRAKMSQVRRGKKLTAKADRNLRIFNADRMRPVDSYSLYTGQLVKTYTSINSTARDGFTPSLRARCLHVAGKGSQRPWLEIRRVTEVWFWFCKPLAELALSCLLVDRPHAHDVHRGDPQARLGMVQKPHHPSETSSEGTTTQGNLP